MSFGLTGHFFVLPGLRGVRREGNAATGAEKHCAAPSLLRLLLRHILYCAPSEGGMIWAAVADLITLIVLLNLLENMATYTVANNSKIVMDLNIFAFVSRSVNGKIF